MTADHDPFRGVATHAPAADTADHDTLNSEDSPEPHGTDEKAGETPPKRRRRTHPAE